MSFTNRQQSGIPIIAKDEGITITSNMTTIDFTGAGRTATALDGVVTDNVSGGGAGTWGSITGTLADQTDLQNELDILTLGKADAVHTHASTDITDFYEAAQDAVATILQNTDDATWTYNDGIDQLSFVTPIAHISNRLTKTLDGTEEVLIVDPVAGIFNKTTTQDIANLGGGGGGYTHTTETANATLTSTSGENIVDVDATAGAVTLTLPTAVGNTAKYTFTKTDSSANTVTIDADGTETINGDTTQIISFQHTSFSIISTGTEWRII